jgi:tetratricopeptide (TPR) repeat protein
MADRYHYLPSIGIGIMLAWGIPPLIKREQARNKILFPAGILFLLIMAFLTWQQCSYWRNSITLFSRALQVTNNNYIAHNHLASALLEKRKFDRAIFHYNEAIRINPTYAHAYLNRGNTYYILGNKQSALDDFKEAINLIPRTTNYAAAFNNLGVAYADLGQYKPAIDNFNEAIMLKPDYADAYNNRGLSYFNQEKKDLGCQDAQKACKLGNCKALEFAKNKGLCP